MWCYELGLPQLSETLFVNLVDGRVLDLLTKDELKKYLRITTKVHQVLRGRGGEGREEGGDSMYSVVCVCGWVWVGCVQFMCVLYISVV